MKKRCNKSTFLYIICVVFVFSTKPLCARENDFYSFSMENNLKTGFPFNTGKKILDAPAGKHGFLKIKNSKFYFENGMPARFWGTNLCFDACFPNKEQASALAEKIAFFGFNAVRFHHMDNGFEPRGIFKDIDIGKSFYEKRTGNLSPEQLDRLDYFIFELKQRGIYVDLNLLVSRRFTLKDGANEPEKLSIGAKPVSMFDPVLIDLQKKYATSLLTHKNPYTGLKYTEDPAIAFVEIINESSILKSFEKNELNAIDSGSAIPEYYSKQLDILWKKWLNDKYPGVDYIRRRWEYPKDSTGASIYERPLYKNFNRYSFHHKKDIIDFYSSLQKKYFLEMIHFLKDDLDLKIPICGIGGIRTHLDLPTLVQTDFIDKHSYWDHPSFAKSKWDKNDFRIHGKSMLQNSEKGIINDIVKSQAWDKPYTVTEWNHCYPNMFAYETPPLFAFFAKKYKWTAVFQFSFAHNLESIHTENGIFNYFDIIQNPQQLILCALGSMIFFDKNQPSFYVNQEEYKFETSTFIIFKNTKKKNIHFNHFSLVTNDNSVYSLIALDDIPLPNSSKILLVAVSQVKNSESGWKNPSQFIWGKGPVLLKKCSIEVILHKKNSYKLYPLKNDFSLDIPLDPEQNENEEIIPLSQISSPVYLIKKEQ